MCTSTFSLTKNEKEIMDLLWTQDRPMSRSEIIELCPNRSWKASSIHILLNQLLDKNAIEVSGFVKTGRNYGRTFAASLTPEEYQAMQFKNSAAYRQSKSAALIGLVSTLVEDEDLDEATLDRLEEILQAKRSEGR